MGLPLRVRHLDRYRQIVALVVRHGGGDLVRSAGLDDVLDGDLVEGDPEAAGRLASDLEEMGPTFIKLGQLLSSRVDLLPPAYIDALSRLQDDLPSFSFEEVEEIVSRELGVRLSKVFPEFDEEPLAAASLAQVHRARLRDGRRVVVKVQRPGIRDRALDDMEVIGELAELLEAHTDAGARYAVGALVEEFRRSLIDELDFRREAGNLETIAASVADEERIVVPAPIRDLTTDRVLTMEEIDGRNVTDLGPLAQLDLDGAPLADALFRAYLHQVLVDGTFHADPHPGNVLVTSDGRLGLVDVGMVGHLAPPVQEQLVKLFLALADARADEVARVARVMGQELQGFDAEGFQRGVTRVVARTAESSLDDLEVGTTVLELTRHAAACGLRLDPELVMLGKTLLNLDQVAATLDPSFSPRDALRRHTTEVMQERMDTTPAALLSSLLEAREFVEALPGRLNRAMDAVGSGSFRIRVQAFDEDEFLRGLHKLANVIAAGLILAALILASAVLAAAGGDQPTVGTRIALLVFVVSTVIGLAMLVRIGFQSRRLHARRHPVDD